jgi:hypothetical protein
LRKLSTLIYWEAQNETDHESNPLHVADRFHMIKELLSAAPDFHHRVFCVLAPKRAFDFADESSSATAIIELLEQKP